MADYVLFSKLIELERDKARRELMEYQDVLRSFEERHQMPSALFFERFQQGELGDDADFFEWSAMYDICRSVQQRLSAFSSVMPNN